MPVNIKIPASEIRNLENSVLEMSGVKRCSRCDRTPANFFEVHRLRYRAGVIPKRAVSNKFKSNKGYLLKIPVCETCYQSDFLTHPETLDKDGSPLGKIAQFHTISRSLGGLLAALGFLLLTPFIPETNFLQPLKQIWQIPVVVGVLVLLLSWLSQRKYQTKVLHELENATPGFRPLPRADVFTPVLAIETDPQQIALEVSFDNEKWAEEVAGIHHWAVEAVHPQQVQERGSHEGKTG